MTLGSAASDDEVESKGPTGATDTSETASLPLDMHIVELLQVLLHQRSTEKRTSVNRPALTVLLSCWDELDQNRNISPSEVARDRIPLVHDMATSVWDPTAVSFLGLSAQGRKLSKDSPDEDFIERGPQQHGYIVMPDGTHESDLTRVIRLL